MATIQHSDGAGAKLALCRGSNHPDGCAFTIQFAKHNSGESRADAWNVAIAIVGSARPLRAEAIVSDKYTWESAWRGKPRARDGGPSVRSRPSQWHRVGAAASRLLKARRKSCCFGARAVVRASQKRSSINYNSSGSATSMSLPASGFASPCVGRRPVSATRCRRSPRRRWCSKRWRGFRRACADSGIRSKSPITPVSSG